MFDIDFKMLKAQLDQYVVRSVGRDARYEIPRPLGADLPESDAGIHEVGGGRDDGRYGDQDNS